MRLRDILWWGAALTAALFAGIFTFAFLRSNQIVKMPMRTVVVAAVEIPMRRSIGIQELKLLELPAYSVPKGAIESLEQVLGKMSATPIFAGETLITQQLVTPDIVTQQVSLSVPKGKIVTAVPTASQLVSNRLIRPGDHIDLLATFEMQVQRDLGTGAMAESIAIVQNQEVHAIVLPAANPTFTAVTNEGGIFKTADGDGQSVLLALTPQDALALRHVLDIGGKLDLALRSAQDETAVTTLKPVDQFYLAERFNIKLMRGKIEETGIVGTPIYAP